MVAGTADFLTPGVPKNYSDSSVTGFLHISESDSQYEAAPPLDFSKYIATSYGSCADAMTTVENEPQPTISTTTPGNVVLTYSALVSASAPAPNVGSPTFTAEVTGGIPATLPWSYPSSGCGASTFSIKLSPSEYGVSGSSQTLTSSASSIALNLKADTYYSGNVTPNNGGPSAPFSFTTPPYISIPAVTNVSLQNPVTTNQNGASTAKGISSTGSLTWQYPSVNGLSGFQIKVVDSLGRKPFSPDPFTVPGRDFQVSAFDLGTFTYIATITPQFGSTAGPPTTFTFTYPQPSVTIVPNLTGDSVATVIATLAQDQLVNDEQGGPYSCDEIYDEQFGFFDDVNGTTLKAGDEEPINYPVQWTFACDPRGPEPTYSSVKVTNNDEEGHDLEIWVYDVNNGGFADANDSLAADGGSMTVNLAQYDNGQTGDVYVIFPVDPELPGCDDPPSPTNVLYCSADVTTSDAYVLGPSGTAVFNVT